MRGNKVMMTVISTVMIGLTVSGIIVSLPRIEKQPSVPAAVAQEALAEEVSDSQAQTTTETNKKPDQPETSGEPKSDAESQSTNENPQSTVLASRSGQVLAQKPSYTVEDLYWMARVISAEAKGESMEGQIAVGAVVMNRLKDGWGSTVKEVIFAPGQFDPVRDGSIHNEPVPSAVEAARRVLQGENPLPDAFYFYNPNTATDPWIRSLRVIRRIGNHAFCAAP